MHSGFTPINLPTTDRKSVLSLVIESICIFISKKTMSSDLLSSTDDTSSSISDTKPKEMTVDEYAELVRKWQQAYYTWNTSCVNYYK